MERQFPSCLLSFNFNNPEESFLCSEVSLAWGKDDISGFAIPKIVFRTAAAALPWELIQNSDSRSLNPLNQNIWGQFPRTGVFNKFSSRFLGTLRWRSTDLRPTSRTSASLGLPCISCSYLQPRN